MFEIVFMSLGIAVVAMLSIYGLASALTAAIYEDEAGSFRNDTIRVIWGVLCAFGRYASTLGFHTEELYVVRSRTTLVVWQPSIEERPLDPIRLKPWKLVLPGWSRFTRIHCMREREIEYYWL